MHGDLEGSVDRSRNMYGAPLVKPNPRRLAAELDNMVQPPYVMDSGSRKSVLQAIIDRCQKSEWTLIAAHVRTNHVHVVVAAEERPEFLMTQLKAAASRRLNDAGFDDSSRRRWARHGSTRALFNRKTVEAAIRYVIEQQGEAMSVFLS
jgi:REP element-mobilizing transposase RayT